MELSRTKNVKKNIIWGNIGNIATMLFAFLNRTIFIYVLGVEYLGVSGLFTNVLGLLSFTELGVGTAMNFSLYEPIAKKDEEKIKSLMRLYKNAYRLIAVVVTILGIAIAPFLSILLNSNISMQDIYFFYFIFLFNTVSSYFVSYKTSYVSALQKEYINTNINTIFQIIIYVAQIIGLVLFQNYFMFLIIQSILGLFQKIFTVIWINKKFPILVERDIEPIDEKTKKEIWKNIKALIIHKIGDISVHQTDNILISAYINTATVGLISNYTMLSAMVNRFTSIIFNSFTASFGNLIAKESKEKQREIFEVYNFLGFWIFGFVAVAFITLTQSLITLWLGKDNLIDNFSMILFFVSVYLEGQSLTTYNFKIAAGRFDEDKWVAFVQAVVNLIVSIAAVRIIGLPGIYIGTIAQRLIVIIIRPLIVYRYVLHESSKKYFIQFVIRAFQWIIIAMLMWRIAQVVLIEVTILRFGIMFLLTLVIPNIIILLFYMRSKMMKTIINKIKK